MFGRDGAREEKEKGEKRREEKKEERREKRGKKKERKGNGRGGWIAKRTPKGDQKKRKADSCVY